MTDELDPVSSSSALGKIKEWAKENVLVLGIMAFLFLVLFGLLLLTGLISLQLLLVGYVIMSVLVFAALGVNWLYQRYAAKKPIGLEKRLTKEQALVFIRQELKRVGAEEDETRLFRGDKFVTEPYAGQSPRSKFTVLYGVDRSTKKHFAAICNMDDGSTAVLFRHSNFEESFSEFQQRVLEEMNNMAITPEEYVVTTETREAVSPLTGETTPVRITTKTPLPRVQAQAKEKQEL